MVLIRSNNAYDVMKTMIKRRTYHSVRPAFTIIELVIVVVVVAILAGLVVVGYNGAMQRARENFFKIRPQCVYPQLEQYRNKK